MNYLIYLFFALFPFINYPLFLYMGTTSRSLNLAILASVLGVWLAVRLFKKNTSLSITINPIFIALVSYLLVAIMAGWLGLNFTNSFWSAITRTAGLWYFLGLGILFWSLRPMVVDSVLRRRLILVIVLSTALYSVLAFFSQEGVGLFGSNSRQEGFTFGNSTFAAMYIFGAWMLSLYYWWQADTKKWWMYLLPVLLVVNPFIISNQIWLGNFGGSWVGEARASAYVILLAVLVLVVVWGVSKIKNKKIKVKTSHGLFVLAVVGFLLAAYSLLTPGGFLRQTYLQSASGARPIIWEIAALAIKERPLLGWGGDNFERVFEIHYDNRLLQPEYNEAWFDRAHNIFIDQMVDGGAVGLVFYLGIYLVTLLTLLHVALYASQKNNRGLAAILLVYFSLHLLELQTAFDTAVSYPLLVVMFALAAALYDATRLEQGKVIAWPVGSGVKYGLAGGVLVFAGWSLWCGAIPFARSQIANGQLRTVGSAEKRIPLYPILFGSPVDTHAILWRTSADFQRGISENPKVLADPAKVEYLKKETLILEEAYREYLKDNPNHFRAHLNLADVLIYQMLFQVDKLEEAQIILDQAIQLVPQSPQAYWMKAVAYLYMQKFDLARQYAKQGLELNPKIIYSQEVVKYINNSIKTFPDIGLFFFAQT